MDTKGKKTALKRKKEQDNAKKGRLNKQKVEQEAKRQSKRGRS